MTTWRICPCCSGNGVVLTESMTGVWDEDTVSYLAEEFDAQYAHRLDDEEHPLTKAESRELWHTFILGRFGRACPACDGARVLTPKEVRAWKKDRSERVQDRNVYAYESGCYEMLGETVY